MKQLTKYHVSLLKIIEKESLNQKMFKKKRKKGKLELELIEKRS